MLVTLNDILSEYDIENKLSMLNKRQGNEYKTERR